MSILSLALAYMLVSSATSNCLASSEDFAAEVVIPSYNIGPLLVIADRLDGNYIILSQYSHDLLTIARETTNPSGLSIRLQIPTELREIEKPHLKLVSSSATSNVRSNLPGVFSGWKIQCAELQCVFEKDLLVLTAQKKGEREVSLEINQNLQACTSSCSGLCFDTQKESKCIDNRMKIDIDNLVQFANISRDLRSLLDSYRTIGSENIILADISPLFSGPNDWEEAMRQELVYLSSQDVIDLTRDEIEDIVKLAREGRAGESFRIVYDSQSSSWKYANEVPTISPSQERDCRAYSLPQKSPSQDLGIDFYYIIPIAILLIGCSMLFVLIVIARLVRRVQKRKR